MRVLLRAKGPAGTCLVTDGVRYAGLPDGVYERAGRGRLSSSTALRRRTWHIAGSVSPMDRNLGLLRDDLGCLLDDLFRMSAAVPAGLLGLSDQAPSGLGTGATWPSTTRRLRCRATFVAGRRVHQRERRRGYGGIADGRVHVRHRHREQLPHRAAQGRTHVPGGRDGEDRPLPALAGRLRAGQDLGIPFLRYGPPYYRTHLGPGRYDWSFADETFNALRQLEIELIVDLCHFGVPDWIGSFQNRPGRSTSRRTPARSPAAFRGCACTRP